MSKYFISRLFTLIGLIGLLFLGADLQAQGLEGSSCGTIDVPPQTPTVASCATSTRSYTTKYGLKETYMPGSYDINATPIKTLKVRFIVFKNAANPALSWQDNATDRAFLQSVFDGAKNNFSGADIPLPSDPVTSVCGQCTTGDKRIRLELVDITFKNVPPGTFTQALPDVLRNDPNATINPGTELNVFFSFGTSGTATGVAVTPSFKYE